MDRMFQRFDGRKIKTPTRYVKDYISEESDVFVGTDSQVYTGHTKFVTAVCMYDGDRGAHVIYDSEKVYRSEQQLFNRLWKEAESTLEVAGSLGEEIGIKNVVMHFDINPSEEYGSHVAHEAAVGLAKSSGFSFNMKPKAWAATCAADHLN